MDEWRSNQVDIAPRRLLQLLLLGIEAGQKQLSAAGYRSSQLDAAADIARQALEQLPDDRGAAKDR